MTCTFCDLDPVRLIWEADLVVAVRDRYPPTRVLIPVVSLYRLPQDIKTEPLVDSLGRLTWAHKARKLLNDKAAMLVSRHAHALINLSFRQAQSTKNPLPCLAVPKPCKAEPCPAPQGKKRRIMRPLHYETFLERPTEGCQLARPKRYIAQRLVDRQWSSRLIVCSNVIADESFFAFIAILNTDRYQVTTFIASIINDSLQRTND